MFLHSLMVAIFANINNSIQYSIIFFADGEVNISIAI